jgi:hypothetical protein
VLVPRKEAYREPQKGSGLIPRNKPQKKPVIAAATKINGTTEVIHRIPYAVIEDLPEDLQPLARMTRDSMDSEMFHELLRDAAIEHYGNIFSDASDSAVVELEEERIGTAAMRRKTAYAGAIWAQTGKFMSTIGTGAYNPDSITYSTYERMQKDAQIALSLALIKKPIEHVNFSVECSSERIKALVQWTLDKIYTRFVRDLLMAIDMGHSCLEKNWKKIPSLKLIKETPDKQKTKKSDVIYNEPALLLWPTAIHPRAYTLLLDEFGDLFGINATKDYSSQPKTVKRSKLVFYTNDMQYGNWFGNSRLKPAYPWWYWSQIVLQFMIRYLERKSSPPIIVRAPVGFSIDSEGKQVNNFVLGLKIGNGLVSNSVGVVPNVFNKDGKPLWDVQYLMDDQRIFMFIEVLQFCNIMMSRAMLVPETVATQSGKGGSFSQTDAHADVHLMNEESLLREVEDVINNQMVPWIVKYNFVPEERVKCTVKLEKLTLTRKQLLKEVFNKMMGVINQMTRDGAIPLVMPDIGAIANALEIPVTKSDNVFDMSTWAPGGGAGGGGTTDPSGNPDVTVDIDGQEKRDENNKDRETKRPPLDRESRRKRVV